MTPPAVRMLHAELEALVTQQPALAIADRWDLTGKDRATFVERVARFRASETAGARRRGRGMESQEAATMPGDGSHTERNEE